MSDLGLGRYRGYADLAAAAPLKARLAVEQAQHLEHGVHLNRRTMRRRQPDRGG